MALAFYLMVETRVARWGKDGAVRGAEEPGLAPGGGDGARRFEPGGSTKDAGHEVHIEYALWGDVRDAPILLLRPLGGSLQLWEDLAKELAVHRRVIAFNPRGVGRSGPLHWSTSTRAMAADARALLDHLGVDSCDVLGLSLGGMVATWFAIDSRDKLRNLVLVSTLLRPRAISARLLEHVTSLVKHAAGPQTEIEIHWLRHISGRLFRKQKRTRAGTTEETPQARRIKRELRADPTPRRNLLIFLLCAFRHAPPELRNLKAPTLLIFGDADPVVGTRARLEIQQALPKASVVVMPQAGHDLSLEKPRELARLVADFSREEGLPHIDGGAA